MRIALFTLLLALVMASSRTASAPAADAGHLPADRAARIIRNARIYTGNASGEFAEAMAMRGEEILYVGSAAGLEPFLDERTAVHDRCVKLK